MLFLYKSELFQNNGIYSLGVKRNMSPNTKKIKQSKIWNTFTCALRKGYEIKFRIVDLPAQKFEEFLDFYMKYFISRENFLKTTGVTLTVEAYDDIREVYSKLLNNPAYHIHVCCPDSDTEFEIIGISVTKICTIYDDCFEAAVQPKTQIVKNVFHLLKNWEDLFPVEEILYKYNIQSYLDDDAIAVQPEFEALDIVPQLVQARTLLCKEKNIPMTGGWVTSFAMEKVAEQFGYKPVFECSFKKLGNIIGCDLRNSTYTCKYMMIDLRSVI